MPSRLARTAAVGLAVVLLAGCSRAGGGSSSSGPDHVVPRPATPSTVAKGASAWPGAIHDARHSSAVDSGVVGPQAGRIRWERQLEGNVTPGPVLGADGTVYSASNAGTLHALNPATGQDRWTFDGGGSYGSDLSTTPSILRDGTILWPGPSDTLIALNPSGQLLWRQRFAGFVLSPADRGDGRVYVMDMAGTLSALDVGPAGHRVAWTLKLGALSYSSPAVSATGTAVAAVADAVVGVTDRGDHGEPVWRWRAPATVEVSPAIGPDGTVVVGLNDDYIYGLGSDGAQRWRWRKGDWSYSSAAVTPDGRAYVGDHLGFLDVLDAATGSLVRRLATIPKSEPHPGGVGVWTSPAVDSAGNVYFGTVVGHVYGFGPDGRQLFDVNTGATVDSYPALGPDGTLYIGSANGRLYALGSG